MSELPSFPSLRHVVVAITFQPKPRRRSVGWVPLSGSLHENSPFSCGGACKNSAWKRPKKLVFQEPLKTHFWYGCCNYYESSNLFIITLSGWCLKIAWKIVWNIFILPFIYADMRSTPYIGDRLIPPENRKKTLLTFHKNLLVSRDPYNGLL